VWLSVAANTALMWTYNSQHSLLTALPPCHVLMATELPAWVLGMCSRPHHPLPQVSCFPRAPPGAPSGCTTFPSLSRRCPRTEARALLGRRSSGQGTASNHGVLPRPPPLFVPGVVGPTHEFTVHWLLMLQGSPLFFNMALR
jgi:hypothetical protein